MQTLREMEIQEQAVRTRAWKLGKLRAEVQKTGDRLASLEAKLGTPDPDVATMEALLALAVKMPDGIITRGSSGDLPMPGGEDLRHLLRREVGFALSQMRGQRQLLEKELPLAKRRAADAITRLAEFEFAEGI